MALAQAAKSHETTYTLDDAMDILLTKLDDAIHDMEAGRVQTIEEAWKEIDEECCYDNCSPHPAGRHGLEEYYQTMDQQKTLNILRIEGPDS